MPQISVIIPVYNVELFVYKCINSVLAQSFRDFELILVDDGSTDKSAQICDEFEAKDNRVQVIHQLNGGLSAARNAGIDWALSNSDSNWISFIDGDDWVHPNYLELLFNAAIEAKSGVSSCLYTRVLSTGEELDHPITDQTKEILSFDAYFSKIGAGFTPYIACAKLYKKQCFENNRFPVGKLNEDLFITHKLLSSCETIVRVNSVLYFYYQSEKSIMRSDWRPQNLDEVEASEKLIAFMKKYGYKESEIVARKRYLWVLEKQIKQIDKQNKPVYKKYKDRLLFKIRVLLCLHWRDALQSSNKTYYFQLYFPKLDWIYWTIIGLLRNINKNGHY